MCICIKLFHRVCDPIVAVSYTHLDVYKRQQLRQILTERYLTTFFGKEEPKESCLVGLTQKTLSGIERPRPDTTVF